MSTASILSVAPGSALASAFGGGQGAALSGEALSGEDRLEIAQAVMAGAWRTLRAAGFHEAEVQALFDQVADRPEDLARRLRKMANAVG
ncbi:hypothetical protein [Caulobacter henricii]|uniref:Uncharacterized protein n=1 Tax=Caulobacter henricii TaxID=69395 RepID=A0A0P0P1B1_9CAUL|nr:hypothetical protein [Caulobacter henricii]ALL14299.1 hypothetical protein AQ619_13615 [Caulobacter henricii]